MVISLRAGELHVHVQQHELPDTQGLITSDELLNSYVHTTKTKPVADLCTFQTYCIDERWG